MIAITLGFMRLRMDRKYYLFGMPAASLLLGLLLFGFVGFTTVAVFWLLFIVPAFLIINNLELDDEEKVYFSLFISLGVFPIAVYYFNRIIPSFRISTVAVFLVAVAFGIFFYFLRSRK